MGVKYKKTKDGEYIRFEKRGGFTEETRISEDEYKDTEAISNIFAGIGFILLFIIFIKSCAM